ncbi:ribosomal protein L14-domain-containing protein [Melampsora americana]|nr:ribosomal protein L14-domain-containing protein [Melampsora americana]
MQPKLHTPPTFRRFVEVGRVVLIDDPSSPSNGRLATIVEIVDHSRALIDGPTTSVPRQAIAFRRVILTPYVLKGLPRGARSATLGKAFEKAEVTKKWEASNWKKSIDAKAVRRSLTDFQRFEVMLLKRQKRYIVGKGLAKAKKANA